MKVKKTVSVFALTALMGLGVLVGAKLAKNEVREADAEGEWLVCSVLDLTTSDTHIPTYEGFDSSSILFRCWKEGDDGSVKEFPMHQTGVENVFMVIAKFESSYSLDHIQYRYTETSGQKYSVPYSQTINSSSTYKVVRGYNWQGGWTGDNWDLTVSQCTAPNFDNGPSQLEFEADPANTRYVLRNVEMSASDYANFYLNAQTNGYVGMINKSSLDECFKTYGTTWAEVDHNGTYDIFLENAYEDGGVINIKEHYDANSTYMYYVLENNTPTNDYIYTWGGSNQFGAWPGTKITEVDGVQEVTGNGVLHFQGSETPKLIYKIPVSIGYPIGDEYFKFNNNNDWESETRSINSRSAYWYTGAANGNAAAAIDFLVEAERIRNLATDYSVCNISKDDATALVNTYLSLGSDIQETYVNGTTVYTHKKDGTEGNELVLYRDVMVELSRIAGISLGGSRQLSVFNGNNSALLVVVISASFTVVAIAVLLTIKKRKQQ